jgi:hypothetical protein
VAGGAIGSSAVPDVVLLGPQRFTRTLGAAVAAAGVEGLLAVVTAGWQEREAEDLELFEHLGERTENLMLYARGEDVLEQDAELGRAHRERQEQVRETQQIYRGRLAHALAALREIEERPGDPARLQPEIESALAAVRALDAHHLARIAAAHAEFEARFAPSKRPVLQRHARQIDRHLGRAVAVAIAGGHVAILVNRLRLFGLGPRIAGKTVFAWSAGAMAIADRVVVFHHFPPQGQGFTEVLEAGLALARGIVPLPHAHRRLALDDARRLSRLARRFGPAACVTMADGATMTLPSGTADAGAWRCGPGIDRIRDDGRLEPLETA